WVRAQLGAAADEVEFCRRPTGGGVVDHRNDWTYALVLPRGHPLGDAPALHAYEAIHRALAAALIEQAVPAVLKTVCEPCDNTADDRDEMDSPRGPGVCFARAERFDVIHADSGAKLAGAAQKRSKR